jgi:DNA-binding HxlR family transcriptional regulator
MGSHPTNLDLSCSIEGALAVIGDRWSLLILRDAFRGIRRFDALAEDLGVARNLLADRLSRLVEHEILEKVPYQERPVRYEYRLTAKGRDLSPALVALMGWGDKHLAGPKRIPTVLVHDECSTALEQQLVCPQCDVAVAPTQIRSRPGPGRTRTPRTTSSAPDQAPSTRKAAR